MANQEKDSSENTLPISTRKALKQKHNFHGGSSPVEDELVSPDDERFKIAVEFLTPVFPSTNEEKTGIQNKDFEANQAFEKGDYQRAQELADEAKQLEASIADKEKLFDLVTKCAKDAQTYLEKEKKARNFLKAGEWKLLLDKLNERLQCYKDEKKKKRVLPTTSNTDEELPKKTKVMKKSNSLSERSFNKKLGRPYTWLRRDYPNFMNQSIKYRDGNSYCECCGTVLDFKVWAQHIHGSKGIITKHQRLLSVTLPPTSPTASSLPSFLSYLIHIKVPVCSYVSVFNRNFRKRIDLIWSNCLQQSPLKISAFFVTGKLMSNAGMLLKDYVVVVKGYYDSMRIRKWSVI